MGGLRGGSISALARVQNKTKHTCPLLPFEPSDYFRMLERGGSIPSSQQRATISHSGSTLETRSVPIPSSIQSLAHEILSQIFISSARSRQQDESIRTIRTTICLVCRRWNDVTVHTPQLWVDIVWQPAGDGEENMNDIARHLQRSGSLLLNLELDFIRAHTKIKEWFVPLVKILRPHLHRAQSIALSCSSPADTLFLPSDNKELSIFLRLLHHLTLIRFYSVS